MRVFMGVLLGAAFIAMMAFAVMRENQVTCNVCLDYRGGSTCRAGSGIDRDAAVAGAVSNVCAVLSSGVTSGIECSSTPPRSTQCDDY